MYFVIHTAEEIPTPEFYKNYDLHRIVTPVKVGELTKQLRRSNYNSAEIDFLEQGFTTGFDIGYEGPTKRKSISDNIPLKIGSPEELWNKIMKEVKLGRVAGPYKTVPFENYIQSPIGLVPKDGGKKTRLIFHLSYDFKDYKSVNHYTPKDKCSVKYCDLDFAIRMCLQVKQQQREHSNKVPGDQHETEKPIFIGKLDVQSAFRLLPLSIKSIKWLIMKAQNPVTKEWCYFVNKCLPFGSSISCLHFQRFSDAIKHLIQWKTGSKNISNYLDDFIFAAYMKCLCNAMIQKFLQLCSKLGIPVAMEKTEWATECLIYLGVLLDGRLIRLALPLEKKNKAETMLRLMLEKCKATVKELQTLCGFLNFLNKVIFPGRTFTRRMYAKYSNMIDVKATSTGAQTHFKFRQYHHVRLDNEFKMDC